MARSSMRASAAALAITLALSSCSSADPVAQELQESAPSQSTCTTTEIEQGSDWIKGQLAAFAQEDPESAYGFASASFKLNNNLQQFVAIIVTNYGFLLNSRSYAVAECTRQARFLLFNVAVTDSAGQKYAMQYTVSQINGAWGVDAAVVVVDDEPVFS